jgi:hypothetical protein
MDRPSPGASDSSKARRPIMPRELATLVAMTLLPLAFGGAAGSEPKATATLYFLFSPAGCAYCRDQVPAVEQFRRDHPDIEVIGIPISGSDEAVRAFVSQTRMTVPVRRDRGERLAGVDLSRHPAIAIYGAECGTARQVSRGEISSGQLKQWASDFLKECRAQTPRLQQFPDTIYAPGGC